MIPGGVDISWGPGGTWRLSFQIIMAATKLYILSHPTTRGQGRTQFYGFTVTQHMVNVMMDSPRYESEAKILTRGNFVKVGHLGSKRAEASTEDVAPDPEKITWPYTMDEVIYVNDNTRDKLKLSYINTRKLVALYKWGPIYNWYNCVYSLKWYLIAR